MKISIIIPCYNAERFLGETLQSVQQQSHKDFECIIVNDGSTDNSMSIIDEYASKDSRFVCYTTENSGCANIARRRAIDHVDSDYVFFLDADDVIKPNVLEVMVARLIETKSDIVLLRLIGCIKELEGELYRLPLNSFDMDSILSGPEACSLTIGRWQLTTIGAIIKKEIFQDVPFGSLMNSDELTSRHLLHKANRVAFADVNYIYRNHNSSISRGLSVKYFDRAIVDKQLEDFVVEKYGIDSSQAKRIRNTRLFNLIYLYFNFHSSKQSFDNKASKKIRTILSDSYKTFDKTNLSKELPFHLRNMFLINFQMFKINSLLYVKYRKLRDKSCNYN